MLHHAMAYGASHWRAKAGGRLRFVLLEELNGLATCKNNAEDQGVSKCSRHIVYD